MHKLSEYSALDFQIAVNDLAELKDAAGRFLSPEADKLISICMMALAHVANRLTEGTIGDNEKGGT